MMNKAYICPNCHNRTLYAIYENDNLYICDECSGEFTGVPAYNSGIKFTAIDENSSNENLKEDIELNDEQYTALINAFYADYCKELDKDAEKLYSEWSKGNLSMHDILNDLGYVETNENKFIKEVGSRIKQVIDLNSLDNTDYIKYYVLHDDEIPSGWTYTKMSFKESINDEPELVGVSKFAVQFLDPLSGWTNSKVVDCPIEAQKERAKLHKHTGYRTKVFTYNADVVKESVNNTKSLVEKLAKFSESVETQNPIDKVVYGSIRVLLESYYQDGKQFKVVGYTSDVSFASKNVKSLEEGKELLEKIRERINKIKSDSSKSGEESYWSYVDNFDRVKSWIKNKLNGSTNESLVKESIEEDEELETAEQKISSANTSINSSKLPAIFNMVDFKPGQLNLDFGGGKFDNATDFLAQKDVESLVYDPYNRPAEHNKAVLKRVRENGGADTITLSNVLNVIAEPESRLAVLRNCKKLLKSGGTLYITVYEGTGKGDSKETKAGYQLNRKTADYLDEISTVFSDVSRKGKLIVAK